MLKGQTVHKTAIARQSCRQTDKQAQRQTKARKTEQAFNSKIKLSFYMEDEIIHEKYFIKKIENFDTNFFG